MPIYPYKCRSCGQIDEEIRKLSEYSTESNCSKCGTISDKMVTVPSISGDGEPVYYQLLGKSLTRSEKRAYLKKNKLVEAGDRVGGSRDCVTQSLQEKTQAEVEKKQKTEWKDIFTKELSGKL